MPTTLPLKPEPPPPPKPIFSSHSKTFRSHFSLRFLHHQKKNRASFGAARLFRDLSLEFLQRRRAKIRVEPLAVNGNRRELAQVRPRGNFVVLVAFIPFQFAQFDPLRVALQ